MNKQQKFIQQCEDYLQKHNINMSIVELFIHFQEIVFLHKEFNSYLKQTDINQSLESMKRNDRLKAKREIFSKWYFLHKRNKGLTKEVLIELSEMVFLSERTVQDDVFK
ncbi:MAG: hypothetical protein KGV59_05465 [Tenacibaculum sp.]|nr:hypothetical protein [Tenacibaculum sp.]